VKDAEGLFFTFCIAFVLAILWWFHDRLRRIEEKMDKMSEK
jgi:hypothetical protein